MATVAAVSADDARPLHFSAGGLPSTILPEPDPAVVAGLERALGHPPAERRAAVMEVVADHPRSVLAWAALGDVSDAAIDRYSAYRVGYHRGLDELRANGWRGSGYVRAGEPGNDAFLRALAGLGAMAAAIGETDEAERIAVFIRQLDPR